MRPPEAAFGHRRRRAEGIPLLVKKFQSNAATGLLPMRVDEILALFETVKKLEQMAADEFMDPFLPWLQS